MKHFIGVDIGGTKISVVRCAADGTVLQATTSPAPAKAGGGAMLRAVERAVSQVGSAPFSAIGVGAAGVIHDGRVVAASESFVDWVGTAIDLRLQEAFAVPVHVLNDVNAFLAGELAWGVGRGESDLFGLTLGTGVGGAVALDGRVWVGAHGMAGEIGHTPGYSDLSCTCGQVGHLETRASGRAIESAYAVRTGERCSSPQIADRAR
ncbi:MAG: ROK family protein, partial [Propionibacteriaceae bacterium]|nr:ROK family protein [Propionibacteriaceae bacterium]